MSEAEKLILQKLDNLGQEVKETKEISLKALEAATEAKEMSAKALEVSTKALEAATGAKEMSARALEVSMKAWGAASESKEMSAKALHGLDEVRGIAEKTVAGLDEVRGIAEKAVAGLDEVRGIAEKAVAGLDEVRVIAERALTSAERANDRIIKLTLLVEHDISKKIDAIGEGHDFLKMKLGEALAMERERERMWLEIVNLRIDVNNIKGKVGIA